MKAEETVYCLRIVTPLVGSSLFVGDVVRLVKSAIMTQPAATEPRLRFGRR